MLVLNRKHGETIIIGSGVEVKVLQIKGNTVRLGIQAPRDVRIMRAELEEFSQWSDAECDAHLEVVST